MLMKLTSVGDVLIKERSNISNLLLQYGIEKKADPDEEEEDEDEEGFGSSKSKEDEDPVMRKNPFPITVKAA